MSTAKGCKVIGTGYKSTLIFADNINNKLQITTVTNLVSWENCSLALFFKTRVSIQLILDILMPFITKSLLKFSFNY